jgi:hypothetical protein
MTKLPPETTALVYRLSQLFVGADSTSALNAMAYMILGICEADDATPAYRAAVAATLDSLSAAIKTYVPPRAH